MISWDIPHWWSLAISLILFLGWRQFLRQRRQRDADDAALLREVKATITSLRVVPLARPTRSQPDNPDLPLRYEATFLLQPVEESIVCHVSEQQYRAWVSGMAGTLQIQGSRFVAFTPE